MTQFRDYLSEICLPPDHPIGNPVDVFARFYVHCTSASIEHLRLYSVVDHGDNTREAQLLLFADGLEKGLFDLQPNFSDSEIEKKYRAETVERLRKLPAEARIRIDEHAWSSLMTHGIHLSLPKLIAPTYKT